ncbi:hypothetical protein CK203_041953 [Vitis vinifera]|uniref:Integrase catalytic domain-containing protein n=1 Tax=Vitis vinifera TaxID=29760 RepID=A0A438I0B6_VITVI|nr:hypothetical protein CK203_041953 [Vitis vinifera]
MRLRRIVIELADMIDGVVPHDEYRDEMDMLGISQFLDAIAEEDQTVPAPELFAFVIPIVDMYEGIVSPIEGASDYEDPPLSFDILSGFVTRSDYIFYINDEITQPNSDRDSFDHNSNPINERVSLATGDVEIVDFCIDDQPRELKIGLPLSTDERDRLIHLLKSYLDVFVKEEIQKQLSVGFISVVEYPEWLANVVPVPKKDGKIKVCVDFRDLNKANPKDDFPLPHIDLLFDSTADHLATLERFFEMIRKLRLRLKSKKCTFGVTYGKLLGHMVSDRGIEVDPDKIKAILDMPVPRTEKEIRGFLDRIKEYLLSPPVLVPPMLGRSFLLYLLFLDMALGLPLLGTGLGHQEIKHYMIEYLVHLISRLDPLRYLFDRPTLAASLSTIESRPVDNDFPDEEFVAMIRLSGWRMYFDRATNHLGYGIGVLLVSPPGDHISRSVHLTFPDYHPTTNNIIEYEALLRQVRGDWKTRDAKLKPYHAYLELLIENFEELKYIHLLRAQNQFADALATLVSIVDIPTNMIIHLLLIKTRFAPAYCHLIDETEVQDDLPWFHDIHQFLRSGTFLEAATTKDRRALRQLATRFVICGKTLYRRSTDGMLLLCLDRASADQVMREVHTGVCGQHMGGHMLARKIMRTDYFWLTMETDCCQFVQRCPECQMHGDLIHVASYAKLTSARVANFIRTHIIYRYGVPHELISNRGAHFRAKVDTLLQKYDIRHHRSSAYRPQTNGVVEAANKNIKRILRTMVETSRDWSAKLAFALWANYTSFCTSIEAAPYSLVYDMEVVLPVKIEMGSLRVALEQQVFEAKPRPLQKGDLVLRILRGLIGDPRGKFRPSWSGPYVIRELTPEGATWLTDLDGNQFLEPTKVDQLKKYYV